MPAMRFKVETQNESRGTRFRNGVTTLRSCHPSKDHHTCIKVAFIFEVMLYTSTVTMETISHERINTTVNSTEDAISAESEQSAFAIFLCISMTLTILLSYLLNPLMLFTLRRVTSIQPTTKICMVSLTMADLIFATVRTFDLLELFAVRWLLGDFPCLVHGVTSNVSGFMSIFSILLLTLDRYVTILYPLRYSTVVTELRTKILACAMWVISTAFVVCLFAVNPKHTICDGPHQLCSWEPLAWIKYFITGIISLTLATIFVLYLHIFLIAHKQARRIAVDQAGNGQGGQRINTRCITTIIIITGTLVITWTPTAVRIMIQSTKQKASEQEIYTAFLFTNMTLILQISNSWINVVIYYLRNKEFRQALQGLLAEWRQRLS
ncbi:melanocortin receptor 5-like [Acanthaster planci]|uniref:Melanocortin receptor 5-like n=1 Tax=Acanthaster planci TaxID=133434 RepID=A0A8B7XFJ0_ACAPL|nr:melanocortin receptor 5-like [Acanthaster planci]